MSKKPKPASAPPTVLVITLEADGNASLLTRRGELAHLSQFRYRSLQEIVTAIQSGATALAELEKNPPLTESTSPAIVADVPETATEMSPNIDDDQAIEPESVEEDLPDMQPGESVAQTKLF